MPVGELNHVHARWVGLLFAPGDHHGAYHPGRPCLALRQTEELIWSLIGLLGLELPVPHHSTLSRRAETLEVPGPGTRRDAEPL